MIRRVVTFVNNWTRLFASDPVDTVTNRNPEDFALRVKAANALEQWDTYVTETTRIKRANLKTDLDRELFDLKQEYRTIREDGSRMSEDEYESRFESINQRQRAEIWKSKLI